MASHINHNRHQSIIDTDWRARARTHARTYLDHDGAAARLAVRRLLDLGPEARRVEAVPAFFWVRGWKEGSTDGREVNDDVSDAVVGYILLTPVLMTTNSQRPIEPPHYTTHLSPDP